MRTLLALGLLAVGCSDKGADDTSADFDTGADDTGADDTGAEDTGADDTGAAGDPVLSFDLSGDYDGHVLSLTWVNLASGDFQSDTFGEVLHSVTVDSADVDLDISEPPSEHMMEIDPDNAPGLYVASYMPTLHADLDGDGLVSAGESYAGAGMVWPFFVSGEVPSEFQKLGLTEGWNALAVDIVTGAYEASDPLAIPLSTNLPFNTSVTIQGTYEGADPGDLGLVLAPFGYLNGDTSQTPLYDEPLSEGAWSIAIDQPPEEHIEYYTDFGDEVAIELPLSYQDRDSSGSYSVDETLYAACLEDETALLVWFKQPTEIHMAFSMSALGLEAGWNAMLVDASDVSRFVDASELQDLVISADCAL